MERLPTVGDLVKLKEHCRRFPDDDRVYLVRGKAGDFFRLYGEKGLISKSNFDIVSVAR